ncbi:hypothetical protein [Luteibacter sp. E-22]|uniref:hypothetical protein n=1 Tax=Luteibacter sp. E-22 TaxID=3404050 RepID=UPI003CF917F5
MNRFLERLADLYAPLGRRGMLMDGQYRFAPDNDNGPGSAEAASRRRRDGAHPLARPPHRPSISSQTDKGITA